MPAAITCPKCASANIRVGDNRLRYDCEDCRHEFAPEKPFAPLRIFLSYGHDGNDELVRRIKADLEKRRHDVWFDKSEIKFNDEWRRSITDGILDSHRVLSFLSKHSTRDPGVCRDEIAIAIGVKGGNIQSILVESEQEVLPPVNIGHIQWLDMHDWKEQRAAGEAVWEPWYQTRLAEIVRVVESEESRRFAGEIEILNGHLKPIKSDARICQLLSKGFYGRDWLFEAVEQWRQDATLDSRLFWIMGAPGVGKSAFAAQLTHTRGDTVIAAQFCEWDKPDHRNAQWVVRSLAFQLATRLPDYRKLLLTLPEISELDRKDAAELFDYLLANPLRSVINGGRQRYLIVIDALDEAVEAGRNPLVEMLARHAQRLPDWLGLVVTSRPEFDVMTALQALNPELLDTKSEENRADIREYVRRGLATLLHDQPDADRLVEQILEKSEGVFLYVERFCDDVQHHHVSLDHPEQFPQGLGGIFRQYFQRQFRDLEKFRQDVRPALRVILAAREPLPLKTLRRLFAWQEEESGDVTHALGSLFPITGSSGEQAIKPYHKSLADWLADENKAGPYYLSLAAGHALLSDKGLPIWRQDKYLLAHLPAHLLGCQRLDDAATLLTDLAYLEARVEAGLAFGLPGDIAAVFRALPEGNARQRLLAVLKAAGRSEKAGMARMTIQSLAAVAEYDSAGVSQVIVTMVNRPVRGRGVEVAKANIQEARVALEVAVAACRVDSMADAVRHVLFTACAAADSNVRSLAIVAVFRLMHENANYPLGLGILQELARRCESFGFIRPRRLEVFAGCALGLFFERHSEGTLARDLKQMIHNLIARVWGVKLAIWLAPKVMATLLASVPEECNPANLAEMKAYKKYLAAHPELVASAMEMISFIDPAHGTSEEFIRAVRGFTQISWPAESWLAMFPCSCALISRSLAGEEAALEANDELWKALPPTHLYRQDFMYRMRLIQVGRKFLNQGPLGPQWTERVAAAIRDFMYEQRGVFRGSNEHFYALGGVTFGVVFVAHQLGHGSIPLLEELIAWACGGSGAELVRWPATPRERQADMLLMRLLEFVGAEIGAVDSVSRETALFGLACFLKHASKFDEPLWELLATILTRLSLFHADAVSRFLEKIPSENRVELNGRMSKILPKEGLGSVLGATRSEAFFASVYCEPPGKDNGLRRTWQEFLRTCAGPKSVSATLRHGAQVILQAVRSDAVERLRPDGGAAQDSPRQAFQR